MGHFTIELAENKQGDVRWGVISKMKFSFFGKNKSQLVRRYTVNIAGNKNKTEYRLYKSSNGEWSMDFEGKIQLDDHTLVLLKDAILEREKELNLH